MRKRVDYTGLHGTLWWRAPEQIFHSVIGATGYAADNWALGCILMEMIWGLPIFRTEERDERKGGWEVLAMVSHLMPLSESPYYQALIRDLDTLRAMDARGGWITFCDKTRELFSQEETTASAFVHLCGYPLSTKTLPSGALPRGLLRTAEIARLQNFSFSVGEEMERIVLRLLLVRFSKAPSPQSLFQTLEVPDVGNSQEVIEGCLVRLKLTRAEFRVLRGIAEVITGLLRIDPTERMTAAEALRRFPFECVPRALPQPTPVRFRGHESKEPRAEGKLAKVLRAMRLLHQQIFFGSAGALMKVGPIDILVLHKEEV